ncbi:STAS domain-containing protein [Sansalvadorimonas verongulae]|uniref:STAS domain-containing protein n=1 Tax=Sansalvadorimonas verongulae TaxID=2172824 RepID=UPI0012BC4DB7|nr:STAS domain-containing protein [Sansalvadorimonas verongulae]MTI14849.1 anti-sigma factor antagonist [Sansalvadorimonas verongulae]
MGELTPMSPGRFALTGVVNKDSVPKLVDSSWAALAKDPARDLVVDLSGVDHADSSALAMLLSWVRRARQSEKELAFAQIPDDLMALARVCGMDELLPLVSRP